MTIRFLPTRRGAGGTTKTRACKRLVLVALLLTLVSMGMLGIARPAQASSSYQPLALGYGDPHDCTSLGAHDGVSGSFDSPNSDTFSYAGFSPLGTFTWTGSSAHGASNVVACNDTPTPSASWDGYGDPFQCEELAQRYAYVRWDDDPRPGWAGGSWGGDAQAAWGTHPTHFQQVSNTGSPNPPTAGDLLVWGPAPDGSNPAGHIAIVTAVDLAHHSLTTLEQNLHASSGALIGSDTMTFSSNNVIQNDRGVLPLDGWLHDPTNATNAGSNRTPTTRQVGRLPNGALATFKLTSSSQIAYSYQSAPGSITWSTWANLPAINGDTPVSDPSVGLNSDGRLFVFARGSSGKIWIVTQTSASSTPTQWGTWSNFTPPFGNAMAGGPAVAVGGNGILYMVALDTNGRVWVQQQTAPDGPWGTYSQFSNPGGVTMTGEPFLAAGPDGRLCLFVRDTTGMIRIECQNGPNGPWGGYSQFSNPNGVTMAGNPIVAAGADGRLCLFVRDTTGMIRIECQNGPNGTYSGYSQFSNPSDGATMTGDPAVVAGQEDGRLYMYVLDNRGQVRPENQNGPDGTWSGYSQFSNPSGVTMTSIPAAGVDSNGEAQLFDVGSDGLMYWSHQTSADGAYVRLAPLAGGNF